MTRVDSKIGVNRDLYQFYRVVVVLHYKSLLMILRKNMKKIVKKNPQYNRKI